MTAEFKSMLLDRGKNPFWSVARPKELWPLRYPQFALLRNNMERMAGFVQALGRRIDTEVIGLENLQMSQEVLEQGGTVFMPVFPHQGGTDGVVLERLVDDLLLKPGVVDPSEVMIFETVRYNPNDNERIGPIPFMGLMGEVWNEIVQKKGYQVCQFYQKHWLKWLEDLGQDPEIGPEQAKVWVDAANQHNWDEVGRATEVLSKQGASVCVVFIEATMNESGGLLRFDANTGLMFRRVERQLAKLDGGHPVLVQPTVFAGLHRVQPQGSRHVQFNPEVRIETFFAPPMTPEQLHEYAGGLAWVSVDDETMKVTDTDALAYLVFDECGYKLPEVVSGVDPRGFYSHGRLVKREELG